MDIKVDDEVTKLKTQVKELHDALDACLPLAAAWAGYWSAGGYGMQGKVHPTHQEILDKAKAALKETNG